MLSFFSNNKKKTLLLFGVGFLFIFLLFLNFKIMTKRSYLDKKVSILQEEMDALKSRKEVLSMRIGLIGEKDHLEKMAREEFGLKKEGEKVVAMPLLAGRKSTSSENVSPKKSFWQKFLDIFK